MKTRKSLILAGLLFAIPLTAQNSRAQVPASGMLSVVDCARDHLAGNPNPTEADKKAAYLQCLEDLKARIARVPHPSPAPPPSGATPSMAGTYPDLGTCIFSLSQVPNPTEADVKRLEPICKKELCARNPTYADNGVPGNAARLQGRWNDWCIPHKVAHQLP